MILQVKIEKIANMVARSIENECRVDYEDLGLCLFRGRASKPPLA